MRKTVQSLTSKNGYNLSFTLFETDSQVPTEKTVLIVPAMAVLQRYYEKFSEYLCNKGFNVITFDYLGIGESKINLKDKSITYQDWAGNIDQILEWIDKRFKTEIVVIAHSAGGQLLGLVPLAEKLVSKAYITSAGIGYWKNWPFPRKYFLLLSWYVFFPLIIKLYGYSPKFVMGEKVPKGVIRQWLYWGRKKRFMLDDKKIQTYFSNFKFNIEFIMFSDDTYAPYQNAKALADFYPTDKVKFNYFHPKDFNYTEIGHFGFFKSKYKETLWPLIDI